MTRVEITPLAAPPEADLAAMTFPVYRPLLDLEPASRHPEQGDPRRIQPLGFVARVGARPVGLVLGELPLGADGTPEMLSLFVIPELRRNGIGRALVAALEAGVARRGFDGIAAVYTAGKPGIAGLERILWRRQWLAPETRTISVRFPPAAALASELFAERRMAALAAGLELFAWRELGAEEKAAIRAGDERHPWITPALAFWRFEGAGFDPDSSVGARLHGEVVAWVLNHRVAPGVVRFTCSFMRKDISRRGRIIPLYRESLRRLVASGCHQATFVTPVVYPNMIRFIQRWLVPIADFVGETRGSRKRLAGEPEGPVSAP